MVLQKVAFLTKYPRTQKQCGGLLLCVIVYIVFYYFYLHILLYTFYILFVYSMLLCLLFFVRYLNCYIPSILFYIRDFNCCIYMFGLYIAYQPLVLIQFLYLTVRARRKGYLNDNSQVLKHANKLKN